MSEIIDESENLNKVINTKVSDSPKKVTFEDEFRNIEEEIDNGKYQTDFKKLNCTNGILETQIRKSNKIWFNMYSQK